VPFSRIDEMSMSPAAKGGGGSRKPVTQRPREARLRGLGVKSKLLRALVQQVIVSIEKGAPRAHLTLRWHGGFLNELDVSLPPRCRSTTRTHEETVALIRRLAVHYADDVVAGVLNRQSRVTATGMRFTANRVSSLLMHLQQLQTLVDRRRQTRLPRQQVHRADATGTQTAQPIAPS